MSIHCEVVLRWDATAEQLRALGAALWGWCTNSAGPGGIYRYLDNQALADLIEGRLPASGQNVGDGGRPYVHFMIPGDPGRDREAKREGLRRAIPSAGVADVRVDGTSWSRAAHCLLG
jgi:hypothetical protein